MIKKILAGIGLLALMAFLAGSALAADEGTVSATVSTKLISIEITSDGEVAYGALGINASQNTVTLTDTQTAANNGNVTEDFNIKGANATDSVTTWILAATAGVTDYTHKFSKDSGSNWTPLTTPSYQTLATGISGGTTYVPADDDYSGGGAQDFDLEINTPTAEPATHGEYSTTVTVQATE